MNKKSSHGLLKLWNNVLIRNILLATVLVVLLLICSNIFLHIFTRHGKSSPVPDLKGKTLDSARIIASQHNLQIEIVDSSIFRVDMPRGSVFLQNPEAGIHVKKNRKIFLTVNAFSPRKVPLPNVKEMSLRLARTNLSAKGFRIGKLEYTDNSSYTNHVLDQMYRGRKIEPDVWLPVGEYIDLRLGLDSLAAPVKVPDVKGLAKQAVEDLIIENSLNYIFTFDRKGVKTITDSLNCVAYYQEPPAGSNAWYGDKVRVKLKLPEKSKK